MAGELSRYADFVERKAWLDWLALSWTWPTPWAHKAHYKASLVIRPHGLKVHNSFAKQIQRSCTQLQENKMNLGHAWEELTIAVASMAVSTQSLQSRISEVYISSLIKIQPKNHLTEEMGKTYQEIVKSFQGIVPFDQHLVRSSANAMTDAKAEEVAQKIIYLYATVCSEYKVGT